MESLYLTIPLFFILLIITYFQIKISAKIDVLEGYILLTLSLFRIKILKIKLEYKSNKIYLFVNKKEKEINIKLSFKEVYFVNQFMSNLKNKIMIKNLDIQCQIGTLDAYTTAMQSATILAISKTMFAYLKTKRYTTSFSSFVKPYFNQNIFLIKIDLCVKITLYDLLYSLIVSLVSIKRRIYERTKQ